MKTAPIVSVFESQEGWHVGYRGGHYADEKTKEAAVQDAIQLAEEHDAEEIDVYNLRGEIIERLPIHRPARRRMPAPRDRFRV